jgi:hypothetical protein
MRVVTRILFSLRLAFGGISRAEPNNNSKRAKNNRFIESNASHQAGLQHLKNVSVLKIVTCKKCQNALALHLVECHCRNEYAA